MSSQKREDNDLVYVKVEEPAALRRQVLETSRQVVTALQKYERIRAIRREKKELTMHLKQNVKELSYLIDQLKKTLPNVTLKETKLPEKVVVKSVQIPQQTVKKESTSNKLQQLEKELSEIEEKLKGLR